MLSWVPLGKDTYLSLFEVLLELLLHGRYSAGWGCRVGQTPVNPGCLGNSSRRGQVLARPDTWEAKVRDSLGQRKEPKLA